MGLNPRIRILLTSWRSLIRSVLNADPVYKLSVLDCPKSFAVKIDRLCNDFFWGYKDNGAKKPHSGSQPRKVGLLLGILRQ